MPITGKNSTFEKAEFYQKLTDNPIAGISASLIASALLVIILFVAVITPTVKTITQLKDEIVKLEEVDQKLKTKIKSIEKIVPEYRAIEKESELVHTALPDNHEFPELEKQIRYLIQKNELQLQSLNISGFPVVGDTSEILSNKSKALDIKTTLDNQAEIMFININLNVTGDYVYVKNFINEFQKIIRITTIDQLTLKENKKSKGEMVDFAMRGSVYYLHKATEEGTTDTKSTKKSEVDKDKNTKTNN